MFKDREDAGRQLAELLKQYQNKKAIIYALPRGGAIVGSEISKVLHLPLELVFARKIGHPFNPEYALCAITEDGKMRCNEEEKKVIDQNWFQIITAIKRKEIDKLRQRYYGDREFDRPGGKTAILVDDGIATGLTMLAAIDWLRDNGAEKIIVAVPVLPKEIIPKLKENADEIVSVLTPGFFFGSVGAYYENFEQVSDVEVKAALNESMKKYDR